MMAISPSKLAISVLFIVTACLTGWFMDICTRSVIATDDKTVEVETESGNITELDVYVGKSAKEYRSFVSSFEQSESKNGVFETLWDFGSERFNIISKSLLRLDIKNVITNLHLCVRAAVWALTFHSFYSVVYFSILILLLTIAGGAICRCAALDFSQGAKPGFTEAIQFSLNKFQSLLTAPLIPVLFVTTGAILIFLLGVVGNIPEVGQILFAIGLLPALLIGLIIAIAVIGTAAASTIMYPAIAYEGSDGFDAISRCYAYVFIKPLSFGLYTMIAAIYGAFCHIFVRFFAYLLLIITYTLISLGINTHSNPDKLDALWSKPEFFSLVGINDPIASTLPESVAGFIVNIAVTVPIIVVAAFVVSFYFCSCTIIYALMRRNVDNTPIDEIYTMLGEIKDIEKDIT